jgi:hypothetical protein
VYIGQVGGEHEGFFGWPDTFTNSFNPTVGKVVIAVLTSAVAGSGPRAGA